MRYRLILILSNFILLFSLAQPVSAFDAFSDGNLPAYEIASVDTGWRLLSRIDKHSRTVELDDGTIWSLPDAQGRQAASKWRLNDTIVIHPTAFSYWAGTRYYLYNERTHTSANAILVANPFAHSPTSVVIQYINPQLGELQLVDGQGNAIFAHVNPRFYSEMDRWRVGQHVLVGSNQDCYAGWFSNYPYILINVERKNHTYVEVTFE